jgi:hypothetical protein
VLFDSVAQSRRDFTLCHDAKAVWHAVKCLQNLADILLCLGKRQLLAIDALDSDRLAARGPVDPNSPDVTTEIASHLTVPFEGTPFVASPVIREHEALELNTIEILEMN